MRLKIYKLYIHLRWLNYLKISNERLVIPTEQSYHSIYVYDEELIATIRVVSDGIINTYLTDIGVHSK